MLGYSFLVPFNFAAFSGALAPAGSEALLGRHSQDSPPFGSFVEVLWSNRCTIDVKAGKLCLAFDILARLKRGSGITRFEKVVDCEQHKVARLVAGEGSRQPMAMQQGDMDPDDLDRDFEEGEEMETSRVVQSYYDGNYSQYMVCGNLFEVLAKYVPPIRPIGKGAYGIVW